MTSEIFPVFQNMSRSNCCGCEACGNACPNGIIEYREDPLGFVYPYIDSTLCSSCGACIKTCPQLNIQKNSNSIFKCLAGYSKDNSIVKNSSSGGLFSCICKSFVSLYSDAYYSGVVWNNNFFGASFILTNDLNDLDKIRSSKYVQAQKGLIYKNIRSLLKDGKHVLFTGCPCEVAALKTYLNKDYPNLYTIDLVCKGPTSTKIFDEYFDSINKDERPVYVNLRVVGEKEWIPQWFEFKYSDGKDVFLPFYKTPLGQGFRLLQRESCYSCHYCGENRLSDLTLGDFHGADSNREYYNSYGTSVVIIHSEKGERLLNSIKSMCVLENVTYNEIIKHNPRIDKPWAPDPQRELFSQVFSNRGLIAAYKATFSISYRIKMRLSLVKSLIYRKMRGDLR